MVLKLITLLQIKGPTPISYMEDIARREMSWINQFAKGREVSDPLWESASQESPKCHLQLLEKCLRVIPQVIPAEKDLHRPTIWHSDLHAGNIFVENSKIVGIIDWQGCMSLPLFLTCRIPKFLRFRRPLQSELPPAAGLSEQEKKDNLLKDQYVSL